MKKITTILLFILFLSISSFSQYMPDRRIDSVLNLVSQQSIIKLMKEITGDTITTIGGNPTLIFSRLYSSPANDWAAQYIYEKFQSYGLNPFYQINNSTCKNVVVEKRGTKYPNQKYVICAHYDNFINGSSNPFDTLYGADDNASGICGVLEAARLIANMNFEYTIVFAAWDEEELGLYGSQYYADSAFLKRDSIKAVINMDMIAYDNDNKVDVYTNSASKKHAILCMSLCTNYIPTITPIMKILSNPSTDITSFYQKGYQGIDLSNYSNDPFYHSINDRINNMNLQYCTNVVKIAIASLMTYGLNKKALFYHDSILSTSDTSPKNAIVVIKFPVQIPVITNSPRLYYSLNNGQYNSITANYRNIDTFKFLIPAFPRGSKISYYFAVQDSLGSYVSTFPEGGSGSNPPGTIPPENPFVYYLYIGYNQCSNTLPKPINDFQITNDTIKVNQGNYLVYKIKTNLTIYHPDDGDLIIQLQGPGGVLNLSQGNGTGGSNYINTTFDDSASISITQGTPPFTGNYKPQNSFSLFENQPLSASWVLRVYDTKTGNTGTLVSWCILMQLKNNVTVKEQNIPVKFELHQNYPNPFNNSTNISYSIPKNSYVELKIYDLLGREIKTLISEQQNADEYTILFSTSELSSGLYFYKLAAGDYMVTKKMLIIK